MSSLSIRLPTKSNPKNRPFFIHRFSNRILYEAYDETSIAVNFEIETTTSLCEISNELAVRAFDGRFKSAMKQLQKDLSAWHRSGVNISHLFEKHHGRCFSILEIFTIRSSMAFQNPNSYSQFDSPYYEETVKLRRIANICNCKQHNKFLIRTKCLDILQLLQRKLLNIRFYDRILFPFVWKLKHVAETQFLPFACKNTDDLNRDTTKHSRYLADTGAF